MTARYSLLMAHLTGDPAAASVIGEEALALLEDDPLGGAELLGFPPWITFVWLTATSYTFQARFDEARGLAGRAERWTRQHPDAFTRSLALRIAVQIANMQGDCERVLALSQEAVALVEQLPIPASELLTRLDLVHGLLMAERWDEAVEESARSLRIAEEHLIGLNLEARCLVLCARAHLGRGDLAKARDLAARALRRATEQQSALFEVLARLVSARVLAAGTEPGFDAEAEQHLHLAEGLVSERRLAAYRHEISELRAMLAEKRGDDAEALRHLGEALRVSRELGVSGHAARLERMLADRQ